MTLKPRDVGPAALVRWIVAATGLLGRNIHIWLALVGLVSAFGYFCRGIWIVEDALAAGLLLVGTDVAALLDCERRVSSAALLRAIWKSLPGAAVWIGIYSIIPVMSLAFFSILVPLTGNPLGSWIFIARMDHPDGSLAALGEPMSHGLIGIFMMMWWLGKFGYLLSRHTGVGIRHSIRLGQLGQDRNAFAIFCFQLLMICSASIAAWVPMVVPPLFAFLSALLYVAFRDIFLGVRDNQAVSAEQSPIVYGLRALV
jgi:hypothetical protein